MSDLENDVLFDEILPEIVMTKNNSANTSSSDMEMIDKRYRISEINNEVSGRKGKTIAKKQNKKAIIRPEHQTKKIYKPKECMKYINVRVHPKLSSQWFMTDAACELAHAGSRMTCAYDLSDPSLVMWSVIHHPEPDQKNSQVDPEPFTVPCGGALYVMTAKELADHVKLKSLSSHMSKVKTLVEDKLTLVVFGVKDYFKPPRRNKNKVAPDINEIEMEMALTDLLVSCNCDAVTLDTSSELALFLVQVTKAIAEAPYKKEKRAIQEEVGFYLQGDNRKCVTVDKDGNGLSRLWQQMIAILPSSSLETSRALCAAHPTPIALYECVRSEEGVKSLAQLGVSRAAAPGATARRLGPEFAKKLAALFTTDDGNTVID